MINEEILFFFFFLMVYFKIYFAQTEGRCTLSNGNSKNPKNTIDKQTISCKIPEYCSYSFRGTRIIAGYTARKTPYLNSKLPTIIAQTQSGK